MIAIYATTYCNHGHCVRTGRPIAHECHVIPPKALVAEIAGDIEQAIEIIQAAKPLRVHRGVREQA
jgi:hypothetical protein